MGEIISGLEGNVTNGSLTQISGSGKTYTATLLPITANTESSVLITANTLTDSAGNTNTSASNTFTWTYNGSAPTVTLTTSNEFSNDNRSKNQTITVTATINGSGSLIMNESDISTNNGVITNFPSGSKSVSQIGSNLYGATSGDLFGYYISLNNDGSIMAVGAPGNNEGHVKVYEWSDTSSSWSQLGSTINGDVNGDYFGHSITLNKEGNIIAIGAISNDDAGDKSGHVKVFEWDSTNSAWSQLGSDIDGASSGDYFGDSISIDDNGEILAIGARYHERSRGHVRVFQWNSSSLEWEQIGDDIDGESSK